MLKACGEAVKDGGRQRLTREAVAAPSRATSPASSPVTSPVTSSAISYSAAAASFDNDTAARRRAWLALAGLSAVFAVSALWRPPDEPALILCPFRALTGLPCPGCGMTRAFCALGHGELWRAVKFNALSPPLFLAAILSWAGAATIILRARAAHDWLRRLRPSARAGKAALALVLAWWAVRLAAGL